jgi:2'-5' RNA ligase
LSGEPTRRLFFALWPDEAQRAALSHATAKVVRRCGGRPVPEASLHVTLSFLGSVPEPRIPVLSEIARRTAGSPPADCVPLGLILEGFEHWAKAQILAVVTPAAAPGAPPSGAASLAARLNGETASAGFSPDLKPFRAHVTVARKVARTPRPAAMRPVQWSFEAFALIESRTLPSGPAYSIVESYTLCGAGKVGT